MTNKNSLNNQKGQALIITFVIMLAILSAGLTMASKYVKGLRNITQADQGNRALAVAEGAIEHLLMLPITTLEEYANNGNCGSNCILEINADGTTVIAQATISILGSSSEPFTTRVTPEESIQVNLQGYPSARNLYVCWDGAIVSISAIYIHGTQGDYGNDGYAHNPVGSLHNENGFDSTSALLGYDNCFSVVTKDNSQMLRVKSIYGETNITFIPDSGVNMPNQGILIESIGTAGTARRKVSVLITDPVLPVAFDYVLYQKSPTEALSN